MGKPDLDSIIKEIKNRGLTAYEISKDVPLSEAGINKILNGNSSPRKSTLLLLHDYLFNSKESSLTNRNEKTPPEEVRFEELLAKRVSEEIKPYMTRLTEEIIKNIGSTDVELSRIRAYLEEIQRQQEETHALIEKKH